MWLIARRPTSRDPPGDLHVGRVGLDREAAVLELGGHASAGLGIEVSQLVADRWLERSGTRRQTDGGKATSVGPDLALVGEGIRWRWLERTGHATSVARRGRSAARTGL